MARQPLQVIVIPFRERDGGGYEFAVFHGADASMWQFIAGGAEDGETVEEAARREAGEEAGIAGEHGSVGWSLEPPSPGRHSRRNTGRRTSSWFPNSHLLLRLAIESLNCPMNTMR